MQQHAVHGKSTESEREMRKVKVGLWVSSGDSLADKIAGRRVTSCLQDN